MTDFAIIVDKQTGFKTQESPVIVLEDGEYLYYELKDNEAAIPIDNNIGDQTVGMNKPQWNFDTKEWVDIEPLPPIKPKPPVPNEMEVLKVKVMALEESQTGQDCIIDDLIFEVIPMLEQQINVNNTQPIQLASVISNKLIKGESAMAAYLAKKIMDGRDYQAVFKTYSYKMYQDEVDTILELEGKGDLIKR